jgi:ornithine cyclodeaminase
MAECIEAMSEVLSALARGEVFQPLRTVLAPEGAAGVLALMPAHRDGADPLFAVKTIGIFPGNRGRGKDTHQGAVSLFDGQTGELLALVNAAAITAVRTAAVSAVATRALARETAAELALVGAGVQAGSHLAALSLVRPLREVRVVSRNPARAARFVEEQQPRYPFEIRAVETVEKALRDADIVATLTDSAAPVVSREWVEPGTHLNVVGASQPSRREVDTGTMAAASLFVDRRESTVHESGDYRIPLEQGAITADHIRAEIGEVLIGAHPGRAGRDEITLFKSLGLACEDLAAAALACRRARETGAGSFLEF